MPKKSKPNNQAVTSAEFNERFEQVDKRFEQIDKRFTEIEQKMATKDDSKRLAVAILDLKDKVNSMEQNLAKNEDIQRIITTLDSMRSQTEDHEHKAILNTERIKEIEPKVENHEVRITSLESHSQGK